MPQLGLLSLFGIVVNTAIIFIEFADSLIKEKAEKSDGSGPMWGMSVAEFRAGRVQAHHRSMITAGCLVVLFLVSYLGKRVLLGG